MYRQAPVPFLSCFIKDDQTWYENKNDLKRIYYLSQWWITVNWTPEKCSVKFVYIYFRWKKNSLEMWHAKWWPFLLGLGVLRALIHEDHWPIHLGCTWPFRFQSVSEQEKWNTGNITRCFHLKCTYVVAHSCAMQACERWYQCVSEIVWDPGMRRLFCDVKDHYNDVIMVTIASKINSLTIVYTTVYSGADQRKHQSVTSASHPRHWPLCGEFTSDRWILRTNGQ